MGDFKQFSAGAQFGAWIGLMPRQHSSGGKNSLGGITKRGDNYLRSLLIQGAKSAVMTAHKRSDPISFGPRRCARRVGWQKAAVALANKNARILWAVMTKDEAFDARHVSVKPGATPTAGIRDAPERNNKFHHAAGISQKMQVTGQTGSGQARLTLGGSIRRCPRDWNGAPLSGSHLGPHCTRITRSVQQGRLQRSSLFLVHALHRRLLLLQPQITTETIDDEYKYSLPRRGSPFKGLGRTLWEESHSVEAS